MLSPSEPGIIFKITVLKFLQVHLKFKQLSTVGRRKILTWFYECSVPGLFALITSYVFNRGLFYFSGIKIVFRNHVLQIILQPLLVLPPPNISHLFVHQVRLRLTCCSESFMKAKHKSGILIKAANLFAANGY